MRKVFHNIVSIILAVLVLCSTLSFAIEKHFCMGEVVDISFFSKVKGCEMPVSSNTDSEPKMEMDCCSNVVEFIESNNSELKLNTITSVEKIDVLVTFLISYASVFSEDFKVKVSFKEYSPPLITKDINILHETFLI